MRNFVARIKPEDGTTFAELLSTLREERGISQSILAHRANIGPSMVSRIESGSRYPSYAMVVRLADALRVDDEMRARMLVEAFVPVHDRADVRDALNAMQPVEVTS